MKPTGRRIVAFLLSCVLVVISAGADSVSVYAEETTLEKLQKAKEEKERTESARENTQEQMKALEITQNSLLGQLSSLNDELFLIGRNLQVLEEKITQKSEEIMQTSEELAEAVRIEQEQYESMKIRIKYMYERGTQSYLDILLSATGFSDFLNKGDYIQKLSNYDRRMFKQYQETRAYVEEVKASLELELEDLRVLQEEEEEQHQKVNGLVQKTASNVSVYESQIEDAEETIDVLENMIAEQEQDIAALQKQYEEELALSRLAAQSAWRDISEVTFEEGDRTLLANLIYCEAGGEPYEGQIAVGAVVINRMLSSRYPNTVVGVIYQNRQFSPVASGRLALALANNKATARCYEAADAAMSGITNVGHCVYFRTPIPGLTGIEIGGHIFY